MPTPVSLYQPDTALARLPGTTTTPVKFGLHLVAVRIQDFRALRDVAVELQPDVTVLIGENNAGKTSFIEALSVAFGGRRPTQDDLHQDPSGKIQEFQIDLRFESGIGEDFHEGVVDIVGSAIQYPPAGLAYFAIRVVGALSDDGLDVTLRRSFLKGWQASRSHASDVAILRSPTLGREALALLQFDMLDARRDIVEQIRNRRSHWGKTTAAADMSPPIRKELEAALRTLSDELVENSGTLSKVRADLAVLSQALSHGSLGVELEPLPRSLDDLVRAMDIIVTAPNSAAFGISVQGMGTRSIAAMLVFRSYINLVRPKLQAERVLSLAAFEEPEAHLHPQAQRAVLQVLSEIGGQKIISTHSAHVASIANVRSYRLFRRSGPETRVTGVPVSVEATWDDLPLVERFIRDQHPDVLFARIVAIVEGQTEAAAFPVLAQHIWPPRGFDGVGATLVHTEGAGNSKHIIRLLDALGIPWILFCDGDAEGVKGLQGLSRALGRELSPASPEIVQLPTGQAFEAYLLDEGYARELELAADRHQEGPLDQYRRDLDGQKGKGGVLRDYHSDGWQNRVLRDFLTQHKGTLGRLIGEEIRKRCEANGGAGMPLRIREFLDRITAKLGGL